MANTSSLSASGDLSGASNNASISRKAALYSTLVLIGLSSIATPLCGLAHFFPDRLAHHGFQIFRLHSLLESFVYQGLVAAPTCFGLEVFQRGTVQENVDPAFGWQHRSGRPALAQHQPPTANISLCNGCIVSNFHGRFFAHVYPPFAWK